MFVPKLYRSEDLELMKKIINENAFALLISNQEKLWATHSMFLWNEAEEGFLETHISKANPQAKYLNDGDEEGLEKKINEKGGNNLIYKKEDFKDDFLALLKLDLEYISLQ